MTRLPLTAQINSIDFSDASIELFELLAQFNATDEFGAIILAVAARLLANEYPDHSPQDVATLTDLCAEFTDLVLEVRQQISGSACAAGHLRVVGGTDA